MLSNVREHVGHFFLVSGEIWSVLVELVWTRLGLRCIGMRLVWTGVLFDTMDI
jgi:hypothetical protein